MAETATVVAKVTSVNSNKEDKRIKKKERKKK